MTTLSTNPRNTFGLKDPATKQQYEDIISAHLQVRRLTLEDFLSGKLQESADRQKDYTILIDWKAEKEIRSRKELDAIISFQHRTTGDFAVVRRFAAVSAARIKKAEKANQTNKKEISE